MLLLLLRVGVLVLGLFRCRPSLVELPLPLPPVESVTPGLPLRPSPYPLITRPCDALVSAVFGLAIGFRRVGLGSVYALADGLATLLALG